MPISSIFANFNITDSKKAEKFAKALDISAKENAKKKTSEKEVVGTVADEIKVLWKKRSTIC